MVSPLKAIEDLADMVEEPSKALEMVELPWLTQLVWYLKNLEVVKLYGKCR